MQEKGIRTDNMKHIKILALAFISIAATTARAQRIQQALGRGVVVAQNGTNATVTWRRLAQEPEDTRYNVYVNGKRVNNSPLANTNWRTTTSVVPVGASVTVTTVVADVESAPSQPFVVKAFDMRNMFVDINFERGGSPLQSADFNTAYVWPIDLDGNGEYDYVVNRKRNTTGLDCYVEAYLATGEHLWTVRLGPNELSCAGQDDMITVADMDCDGRGDVVIQSSDGTQFWDPDKKSFGLYVKGKTTADTDGDGIVDYEIQGSRNAPRYISVIDGLTGREKASIEQSYNQHYNRTNRAALMGDEYNKHVGHMGIAYLDGVHPAVVMEWHMRGSGGDHHYYNLGVAYDFSSGRAGRLKELFNEASHAPAFHQIRIGDPDGDGCDEMIVGGYTMDHDGHTLFNTGISHGDRFRTSDIDPERPGLETFAVQQNAGDMLGQVLYDAATGEFIKKWYMPGVADVGRGECIDIDPAHLGWEMWSTMDGNVYDAQGNLISGYGNQFPCEGIWWDDELDREVVNTSDSHYNVYVQDFFKGREVEFAKISNWRYTTVYAKRAAFWGDIIGDWREELILLHKEGGVIVGFVGVTTDYTTAIDNIYCLQEDPHYRGDCSTKGYYQSPNPGFYLGYDMPRPQLPPCMVTDLVAVSDARYSTYDRTASADYADGRSLLFDHTYLGSTFNINGAFAPSVIYAMPVRDQSIMLDGTGSVEGSGQLWKGQQGRFIVNRPLNHTGGTYITEGILEVNTTIIGDVHLRARGTLAGNAVVAGRLIAEGALNYEGCRLMPGSAVRDLGTITIANGLNLDKRLFMEMDVDGRSGKADLVQVQGDVVLAKNAQIIFTIVPDAEKLAAGTYPLLTYTGTFTGQPSQLNVRGLQGLSYNIINTDHTISLVVNAQRAASDKVRWNGGESNAWDYQTPNFLLDGATTEFVAGDAIGVGDDAQKNTIQLGEVVPVAGITFDNEKKTITLQGNGGIGGNGYLLKTGAGRLNLNCLNSNYTGLTVLRGGTVAVKGLSEAGLPGCLGAASADAANWQMGRVTFIIDNANTATTRGLTLTDTTTIQIASGVAAFKGIIAGNGTLVKTGAGQLNVTYPGTNTWKSTILQGGSIAMGVWNTTFGNPTSDITVTGNASIKLFNNNSTGAVPTLRNTITVEKGRTLTIGTGQRCAVQGAWKGQGTIKISFPYVRGDVSANVSQFEGTINVTGGQYRLVSAMDLSKGTFQPEGDAYVVGAKGGSGTEVQFTHKIGALTGTSADAQFSTGTWNVGYLGTNTTFAGTFNSNATLNKQGTGTLTLTGASTAPFTVAQGTVLANCTTAETTTGMITVANGGTLRGTGKAGAVTVNKGGILAAGKEGTTTGTLSLTGALSVKQGGIIQVRASGTAARTDAFKVDGRITLRQPVFQLERISGEWQADTDYRIFTGSGSITLTGEPVFEPAVPMPGYVWDYSRLATDGILRIVSNPDAIRDIQVDDAPATTYDLGGRRIDSPKQRGVYVVNGKKVAR